MTLTKADIIDSLYNGTDLTKLQSVELVDALIEIMKRSLEEGDDILITGFGKFCVKDKKQRRGRNPQTGRELMLDARRVVAFQCSGVLRDRINGKG
jgi:integration host factor subunit alpha